MSFQIADEQLSVLNNAALEDKLTKYLNNQIQSNSLLKKHLTPEILADLKHQMTSSFHSTIFDVVKTGEIFLISTNNNFNKLIKIPS